MPRPDNVIDLGACRAAQRRGEFASPLPRYQLPADVDDLVELVNGWRCVVEAVLTITDPARPRIAWVVNVCGIRFRIERSEIARNLSTGARLAS